MATLSRPSEVSYRNQAAQRVLSVLEAFTGIDKLWTAAQLCQKLGMSSSMVHGAIVTLESEGYLTRAADGKHFQLGFKVLTLTNGASDDVDMGVICHPYMDALQALTGESVFLSIIVGNDRVVVDKIEARGPRVAHIQRGLAVPLHAGKASRSLLACLDDDEINDYLANAAPLKNYQHLFAEAAEETNEDVWADIRRARADGYIAWLTSNYGGTYVTFPIVDPVGRPHATISVGAPSERVSLEAMMQLLPDMLRIISPLRERAMLVPAIPVFLTHERA